MSMFQLHCSWPHHNSFKKFFKNLLTITEINHQSVWCVYWCVFMCVCMCVQIFMKNRFFFASPSISCNYLKSYTWLQKKSLTSVVHTFSLITVRERSLSIRASHSFQICLWATGLASPRVSHDPELHKGDAQWTDEGRGGGLEAERLFPRLLKSQPFSSVGNWENSGIIGRYRTCTLLWWRVVAFILLRVATWARTILRLDSDVFRAKSSRVSGMSLASAGMFPFF